MTKRFTILVPAVFFSLVLMIVNGFGQAAPFEEASVHFEQNATDGDVEVVFKVLSKADGLVKLTVVSPDGRVVIDFKAPDKSTLGIRSFKFESPEPEDKAGLKAAYPEGVYKFSGAAADGFKFSGEAELSHELPATVSIVQPAAEVEDVPYENLVIKWTPVKNPDAYIIELEQEEMNVKVIATIPGTATSFAIPNDQIFPGKDYKLGIGTVSEDGNISFVETEFSTAEKK